MNSILTIQQTYGSASFVSVPSGAKIFIDDVEQPYTTPRIIDNITVGSHRYTMTYSGYIDVSGMMEIEEGQIYDIFSIMQPSSGKISEMVVFGIAASFVGSAALYLMTKEESTKSITDQLKKIIS